MFKSAVKKIYEYFMLRPMRFSPGYIKLRELFNYTEREKMLLDIMDFVRSNRLEGDYLEFGVYKCGTLIPAYHFSKSMGKNLDKMRFYGFDSFEGLPEVKKSDNEGFKHFSKGDYANSLSHVVSLLKKSKVNMSRVKLIKGWYNQVLNNDLRKKLFIKKAAVVWVDCDLYESTVPVLDFITPYLQDGTILVFDDWLCFRGNPEQGEQKAFSEWLKKNKKIQVIPLRKSYWGGQAFILRFLSKLR